MKLRNKKTGKIGKIENIGVSFVNDICTVQVIIRLNGFAESYYYHSLAEFNAEWEDYEPAVPLINDVGIREVVRAWAEINSTEKVIYAESERTDGTIFILTDTGDGEYVIEFVGWVSTLEDGKEYTINELCGEDEE